MRSQKVRSPKDTIEEKIVKCNVAKMELDYKFGGQMLGLGTEPAMGKKFFVGLVVDHRVKETTIGSVFSKRWPIRPTLYLVITGFDAQKGI